MTHPAMSGARHRREVSRKWNKSVRSSERRVSGTYARSMGRSNRAHEPGGIYHVSTRGNNRAPIYFDEGDRTAFRHLLGRAAERHEWAIFAECLMTNHYHFVVQIGERLLADGMCELNGGFARAVNSAHGRQDHLFGKRYDDTPIESDAHLLEVCRYVVLNPVRAQLT